MADEPTTHEHHEPEHSAEPGGKPSLLDKLEGKDEPGG